MKHFLPNLQDCLFLINKENNLFRIVQFPQLIFFVLRDEKELKSISSQQDIEKM